MEEIIFRYTYYENDAEEKVIKITKRSKDGVLLEEACEAFEDFMDAAGYGVTEVLKYFQN